MRKIFLVGLEIKCSLNYLQNIFYQFVCYYPSEDANTISKSSMNEMESKGQEDLYKPTKEDLEDYIIFLDNVSMLTCQKDSSAGDDPNILTLEQYFELFYKKLHLVIKNNIYETSCNTYIQRIDKINRVLQHIS